MYRSFWKLKVIIIIMLFAGTLLLSFTADDAWGAAANEKKVTIILEDSYCPGCPAEVKLSLKRLAGVTEVRTRFAKPEIVISYDESTTTVDEIIKAVKKSGFTARVVQN